LFETHYRQDVEHARFTECFLPVVTAAPAVIAALILLTYSMRILEAYRPRWTKPFVQETRKEVGELNPATRHHPLTATLGLLVATGIGLALQIITIVVPDTQVIEIYPSIAWVRLFSEQIRCNRTYTNMTRLLLQSSFCLTVQGQLQCLYCFFSRRF